MEQQHLSSSQLLPAETWALYCLTFSLKKKKKSSKLEIRQQIHIIENNSVFWGECSYALLFCGLFEPYFLGGNIPSAWVTSFWSQAAAKAAGDMQGGSSHPWGRIRRAR